jgi:SAM-dependent methyltransferase
MRFAPDDAKIVLGIIEGELKSPDEPSLRLARLWHMTLLARCRGLTADLRRIIGDTVHGGPFKGMKLTEDAIKSYRTAVMLGCYEHELHPVFEKVMATDYTRILNIGCSVGYYAVGLAMRMPHVIIEAFDIDPEARRKCAELARANGVEDRIKISGEFFGDDFAKYEGEKILALVDIEGAETELLAPAAYPALRKMDVIVELHDVFNPAISKIVTERFMGSHNIRFIPNQNILPDMTGILAPGHYIDPFDQVLLGWESRDGATPWGVYYAK